MHLKIMCIKEKKIQISFLIVSYNSTKVLIECIKSLKRVSKNHCYEILVSNNDKSPLELKEKFVKIINNNNNLGFGKANNIISKIAVGEVLIFVNPDTYSFSLNFCDIINLLNNEVGIVAPAILNENGSNEKWSYGGKISPITIIKNNVFGFNDFCSNNKMCDVGWVSGAVFCIKRQLFNKIGGFDEKFFLYYEDADICKRISDLGFKIVRSNSFKVRHIGGSSMDKKSKQKKYYYNSQFLYINKHYGKIYATMLKLIRKLTHRI